jgi:hypothetical protein
MSIKVVEILGNDISSIIRKYLLPKQDKKSINYLNNIFKFINSGHIGSILNQQVSNILWVL